VGTIKGGSPDRAGGRREGFTESEELEGGETSTKMEDMRKKKKRVRGIFSFEKDVPVISLLAKEKKSKMGRAGSEGNKKG